jgi:hypothetical protein
MPPFSRSESPPEVDDDHLEAINAVIARLRGKIVSQISLPGHVRGLRTLNLVRGYLQAHLRRMIMFVDGGHAEHIAGRPLMTELASRAIYENVANYCDFSEKLKPLCETMDYETIDDLVRKSSFTTRLPDLLAEHGKDIAAPNILGQIDRMNRRYPDFRSAYDHLSEIVHPNGLGSVVYFARMSDTELTFFDKAAVPERAIESLISASFMLLFVDYELNEIESRLQRMEANLPTEI